jgi:hypothetical protein
MLTVVYAKCRKLALHADCHYAECLYGECLYAECCGASDNGALMWMKRINQIYQKVKNIKPSRKYFCEMRNVSKERSKPKKTIKKKYFL